MRKRPLCVLCCCFILLTILLTVSGLPVPWQEQIPSELSQTIKDGAEGCLYGQLYRIQEKSSGCTLYIKNSILVVHSNRYSLNNSKIIYDKVPKVRIGNSLCVFGKVSLLQKATNPGQFDAAAYEQVRHISVQMKAALVEVTDNSVDWLSEAARRLQASMGAQFDKGLTEQESGVLKTMLLGDKADLDAEIRQLYQKGGISHILAISGVKTLKLDIPLVPETRINWTFVPLHIAIIYILKLCLDEEIIPRCRFTCSRGYLTKYIN